MAQLQELSSASLARPPHDHFVQFYERDETLVASVATYLANGLNNGAGAIVISTETHRAQLQQQFRARGIETREWIENGRLILLDAAGTLEQLLVEGWPDEERFERVVGKLVAETQARFGNVAAFGEMVALLWGDGQRSAAVRLEQLWNGLAQQHEFALYCAYPMHQCANADALADFRAVCDEHSSLIPGESIFEAADEPARLRMLAQLQQRAASLEMEMGLRRRTEAMLADRERELTDLLENGVFAMHSVSADGTILWANRAELQMLGYEREEYVGRNIREFYADPSEVQEILQRLAAGDTLQDHATRLIAKDGSVRHVLVSSNARTENGRLAATRCITRDVTDRWLAQEALRERAGVLHLAMQGARMGYWIGDLESNTVRCSHELAALFGLGDALECTIDEFLGHMHADDAPSFHDALRACVAERHPFVARFRAKGELADWRWFEGRGEGVYGVDGAVGRIYGVCIDITQRQHEERMLAHLAAIVDSAEDAIVSKTLDGIVTSWNRGAQRIFGYEAHEMIGQPITKLIPGELQHEETHILGKIRRGEHIEHYQTRRLAKDGTARLVSLAVSPIFDSAGRIIGASKIARLLKAGSEA